MLTVCLIGLIAARTNRANVYNEKYFFYLNGVEFSRLALHYCRGCVTSLLFFTFGDLRISSLKLFFRVNAHVYL